LAVKDSTPRASGAIIVTRGKGGGGRQDEDNKGENSITAWRARASEPGKDVEGDADGIEEVVNEHARGGAGKASDGKPPAKAEAAWFPEWRTISREDHKADGGEEGTIKPCDGDRLEYAERRKSAETDGAHKIRKGAKHKHGKGECPLKRNNATFQEQSGSGVDSVAVV
jgi:hypothetical protein